MLGANAQGKTNLLEAIYYPVLFRSLPGRAGPARCAVSAGRGFTSRPRSRGAGVGRCGRDLPAGRAPQADHRRRRGAGRLADAVGRWLAVAFLPADVGLASRAGGGAPAVPRPPAVAGRPRLSRARSAATVRRWPSGTAPSGRTAPSWPGRSTLRSPPPARRSCEARRAWAGGAASSSRRSSSAWASAAAPDSSYRARRSWPIRAPGPQALAGARRRDRARRLTTVGPHRDDLRARDRRAAGSGSSARPASSAAPRSRSSCWRSPRCARRAAPSRRCCWTTCSPSWTASGRSGSPRGCGRRPSARCSSPPRGRTSCRASLALDGLDGGATAGCRRRARRLTAKRRLPRSPTRWPATSKQAGLLQAGAAGGDHRGVGRAGGPADRRGHRARIGHPGRRAAGAGGHRGLGQRAEPDDAPDPGPAQRRPARGG